MSTATTTARDALTAQLERLYYIERELATELETLATDAAIETLDDLRTMECREQLQYEIDAHREATETHLERIERAFEALDTEPDTRPVPELDGLIADKEAFNNVVLNDALRPLYYIQTVLQLEALECTVYESTIALASALGDDGASVASREGTAADGVGDEVAEVLRDNYDDERQRRTDLEALADGEALETLLESNPIGDTDRASLDRSWREEPDSP